MIKIIDNIRDIDGGQWERLLQASPTKSFFQTKDCYDLYAANSPHMQPFCMGVEEQGQLKGIIVGAIQADGGMVKRFLSRRAIINSGPLLADDISDEALMTLLQHCRKSLRGKAIYTEFRNFEDYSRWKDVFMNSGFDYVPHLNFHIDTSSEEIVEDNLSKSRKRNIRLSFRDGAEVVENPSKKDMHEFYDILFDLYVNKVKTPLYPLAFFDYLFSKPYAKYFLVRFNGKIVGGTLCVSFPGHALYEWFACGEDGVHKNIYPSSVAKYAAIMYAARNGYHHYDMMGAGKPNEAYGVRDFKSTFGGQLVEHGRFQAVISPLLYEIGKVGVKIIKKL